MNGVTGFLRKKASLARCYFFAVLILGMLYSIVLPPLSAPDEVAHYIGAYALSSQIMGRPSPLYDEEGRLMIRQEDVFLDDWQGDGDPDNATVIGRTLSREVYAELKHRGLLGSGEEGYHYTLQEPVKTTPLAYLFPALGFVLARLLGLGGFGLLYMGRGMNLLFFTILGTLAVKRTPVGKEIFFAVSLFPMTLELVSSLSYDCFILGLCFYFTGKVLELGLEKTEIRAGDAVILSVLAIALSPCKMVYSLLFLACFLIPVRKFRSVRSYILCVFLIGVLMVGSIVTVNLQSLLQYVLPGAEAVNSVDWVEGAAAAETYHLHELLKNPIILLKILRNTLEIQGGYYLFTMGGGALGHLDESLGLSVPALSVLYGMVLCLNLLGDREEPGIPWMQRGVLFLAPVLVAVLLLVSMLTAYTPLRTDYVLGVQGRYFLPLLPMWLMSFHGRVPVSLRSTASGGAVIVQRVRGILLLCMVGMNLWLLGQLFLTISGRSLFPG